jgi:predicted RNA polymerase sigma factor
MSQILASLAPLVSEVYGLSALMKPQSSRLAARTADDGRPILLLDQDRSRWDPMHIADGLAALERAEAFATELGPYALQAAIAACHALAEKPRSPIGGSSEIWVGQPAGSQDHA